jgi:hypothetical protein
MASAGGVSVGVGVGSVRASVAVAVAGETPTVVESRCSVSSVRCDSASVDWSEPMAAAAAKPGCGLGT